MVTQGFSKTRMSPTVHRSASVLGGEAGATGAAAGKPAARPTPGAAEAQLGPRPRRHGRRAAAGDWPGPRLPSRRGRDGEREEEAAGLPARLQLPQLRSGAVCEVIFFFFYFIFFNPRGRWLAWEHRPSPLSGSVPGCSLASWGSGSSCCDVCRGGLGKGESEPLGGSLPSVSSPPSSLLSFFSVSLFPSCSPPPPPMIVFRFDELPQN